MNWRPKAFPGLVLDGIYGVKSTKAIVWQCGDKAFSGEVGTGSREENALKTKSRGVVPGIAAMSAHLCRERLRGLKGLNRRKCGWRNMWWSSARMAGRSNR